MAPKRHAADWDFVDITSSPPPPPPIKRTRVSASISNRHTKPKTKSRACYYPASKYKPHRDSGVGKDFHSVPYPLSLLPKTSWASLTNGDVDAKISCSQCGKERATSAHQRKLFLVAERLSWEINATSRRQREQNEISTWAVNAELDIFEPVVEEEDIVLGGIRSRGNEWYPYQCQDEAEMAMKIVETSDMLTERSWRVWKEVIDVQLERLRAESRKQTDGEGKVSDELSLNPKSFRQRTPRKQEKTPVNHSSSILTPSSALEGSFGNKKLPPCSYESLQRFYSLLDQIERTSPMAVRYLEAYAEQLHKDKCIDCWFNTNIIELPSDSADEGEEEHEEEEEKPQARRPSAVELSKRYTPATQPISDRISRAGVRSPYAGLPSTMQQYPNSPWQRPMIGNSFRQPRNPLSAVRPVPYYPHPPPNPLRAQPQLGALRPTQTQQVQTPPRNVSPAQTPIQWLQRNFVADPNAEVLQHQLYRSYRAAFEPQKILSGTEFIAKTVPAAFPAAEAKGPTAHNTYVVSGIRPRSSTITGAAPLAGYNRAEPARR